MYKIKNDHEPFDVFISVSGVTDAEGEPVEPSNVNVTFSSSDTSVLQASFLGIISKEEALELGNETLAGANHYRVEVGRSGQAALNAAVFGNGPDPLAVDSESFLVTTGDPAAVGSINIVIPGLTPEPEATE